MPIQIRIKQVGISFDQAIGNLNNISAAILTELPETVKQGTKYMRSVIRTQKHRAGSSGNLEKSIKSHATIGSESVAIGIGLISLLDSKAPYWYLINYGGMVSPEARRVPGVFNNADPPSAGLGGTGVGTEEFTYKPQSERSGSDTFFLMNVGSPIAPMNYIQKTAQWLYRRLIEKARAIATRENPSNR